MGDQIQFYSSFDNPALMLWALTEIEKIPRDLRDWETPDIIFYITKSFRHGRSYPVGVLSSVIDCILAITGKDRQFEKDLAAAIHKSANATDGALANTHLRLKQLQELRRTSVLFAWTLGATQ